MVRTPIFLHGIFCSLHLRTSAKSSDDDGSLYVVGLFNAVMRYLRRYILTKIVESKAVRLQVDDVQQREFQLFALRWVNLALEDGVLYTLSIRSAFSRDLSQTPAAIGINGLNIIGD